MSIGIDRGMKDGESFTADEWEIITEPDYEGSGKAVSSSRMYQDIIPAYATRLRNGLLHGVTDIILEHGPNDLANRTLAEIQQAVLELQEKLNG